MILIDSNFYIDSIRRREDIRMLLQPWIQTGQLLSCGVIRTEVIRGILSIKIKRDLMEMFDVISEIPTDAKIWRDTTEIAWRLDRHGIILPITDLVIAACALQTKSMIISEDGHFTKIPGLNLRRTLPRFV